MGRHYIAETKPEGTRTYDLELLPHVTSHFQSSTSSLFLILHLQGSHEPCAIYYPPSESFFEVPPITTGLTTAIARDPVMRRNHYDNSIRYTDQLLGELINLLAATPRPAYMIYLSDYGESPDSPTWRDVSNPTTWEVPLVIYLNPEYQSAYPQIAASIRKSAAQPQSLDHLLAIILQSAALLPNPPSAANSHSTPASTATNPPSPTSSPS